jgi:RNA polymerase sigma-70 factor (ECF subfamily)
MSTWKEMSDEQLALLYADGNNKAFDVLLSRVQNKLFSYIFCMVKNEEMANDLFQETFIKAIMKLRDGKYKDNGKFLFWLTRIAHNVIIDQFRDMKNAHIVDAPKENDLGNLRGNAVVEADREKALVNEQVLKDVRQLMEALPDVQREVVYMRYYQDMSFKEIAKVTGVSINTSLGRMRYALINLRRLSREHHVELQFA